MTDTSVLVLALGPVQDFIVRARRTRDLWFGSYLLSELSRAAARSLTLDGWTLVFPAFAKRDQALEPLLGRISRGGTDPPAVVNKVVAVGGTDPEEAACHARQAALDAWKTLAARAYERGGGVLRPDTGIPSLKESIEDVLEFYAGWGTGPYDATRRKLDGELASRKNLKEFTQWRGAPRPKSSLDGFRETVLVEGAKRGEGSALRAARLGRLGDSEQLDAIGFVKRFGGDPQQFPSVARVAVQPWVESVLESPSRSVRDDWEVFKGVCRTSGIGGLASEATGWADTFPHDGEVFFRDRRPALEKEAGQAIDWSALDRLLARVRATPVPYVACLAADGDGMGAMLNEIGDPDRHRDFSGRLAGFAAGSRSIVEAEGGALVYSGGDDVLALLPASAAPRAAMSLAKDFRARLGYEWLEGPGPTLSVGIGIGHFLAPLGELLALGRRAEKLAKGNHLPSLEQRDALAIVLAKRGSAEIEWRARWRDDPVGRLAGLSLKIAEDRVPSRFAYELRDQVLGRLPAERPLPAPFDQILRDEVARTWRRKLDAMGREGTDVEPPIKPATVTAESLEEWVAEFGIAKHLAEHDQVLSLVRRSVAGGLEAER